MSISSVIAGVVTSSKGTAETVSAPVNVSGICKFIFRTSVNSGTVKPAIITEPMLSLALIVPSQPACFARPWPLITV